MSWATVFFASKSGVEGGDGWITVVLGGLVAGMGLAIGLRKSSVGYPITAAVASLAAVCVAVFEVNDVNSKPLVSVGGGLWLVLVAAIAGLCVASAAIFTRA
jgi:hypothetical protein